MILKCTKLFCFIFLFLCHNSFCQNKTYADDELLIRHLTINGLYNEKQFLLDQYEDQDNVILQLDRAWNYNDLNKYDSAISIYQKLPLTHIIENNYTNQYLTLLFKHGTFEDFKKELIAIGSIIDIDKKFYEASDLFSLSYNSNTIDQSEFSESVRKAYKEYYGMNKKSGVLAGLLSTIIPGSGKAYTGKWRQALNALIVNSILGVQTYEAYRKAGINNARFYVFGTLFSAFYIGNIYGSAIGVSKTKSEYKNQLQYEISNYYFSDRIEHPTFR